jgi:hypothetical protein
MVLLIYVVVQYYHNAKVMQYGSLHDVLLTYADVC